MGKSQLLTVRERGKIDAYVSMGLSKRDISRRIRRSVTAITTYLREGLNYGKNYKGSNKKLTTRELRRIRRIASNRQMSSRAIAAQLNLRISTRSIRRALNYVNLRYYL